MAVTRHGMARLMDRLIPHLAVRWHRFSALLAVCSLVPSLLPPRLDPRTSISLFVSLSQCVSQVMFHGEYRRHLAHSRAPHKGTPNGDPQDLEGVDIGYHSLGGSMLMLSAYLSDGIHVLRQARFSGEQKLVRGELDAVFYGFNLSGTQGLLETH